jgi:hypothetical protein
MKKIVLFFFLLLPLISFSQTTAFYKGEWSVPGKQDLFSCTCKVIYGQNGNADIEFIWTYKAIDSSDDVMIRLYENKKGLSGVELASGHYDKHTHDLEVTGYSLQDPYVILAMAKYSLKVSPDKNLLYGTTSDLEDRSNGVFAAVKVNMTDKQYNDLRKKVH